MKKVIVTGINGLIGQYIYEPLHNLGFEVYGIGTKLKNEKNYFCINLNNHFELANIFNNIKPEYLIHLAWDTKKGYLDSDSNFDLLSSSINMLKYFKDNGGKKVIFTGTCFEYQFKNTPIYEHDELNPTTIYAKCKNYLREISEMYCTKHNIDLCWARIFYVYGKNENPNRLFPYIIKSLKNNKKVIINHSQLEKDYLFAGDIANIFSLLLDSDFKGSINICSGKAISINEIASKIAKKMNKEYLLELKTLETNEAKIIIGDNTQLIEKLKFKNYTNIDKIIEKLILEY
ncbi:NAD-dependent epimerase [Brachyspira hyodysenteriae]|uniref:NAD-dependent epimerase/dehydratase family protein n=2 Tax=Brachyspira hyodysenteriae TaxID=159 RepID=UPI00063DCAF6|nr:NAD(P)-dependent oxidoreductase [Brachyspira hyodysenteriae]KLI21934.1 NAD-dependent epimerase [Brachyspira hyodysenteriae]